MKQISEKDYVNLYNLNRNKLYASALKIVKDRHATEDIVQEVFLRLYKQDFSKIKDHIDLWLFTVCRNLAIKAYHRQMRVYLLGEEKCDEIEDEVLGTPYDSLTSKERVNKLLELFKTLSKKQLNALKLRYYKDLSYKQIAKKMKTTDNNVGFLISMATSNLRGLFQKEKKYQNEY